MHARACLYMLLAALVYKCRFKGSNFSIKFAAVAVGFWKTENPLSQLYYSRTQWDEQFKLRFIFVPRNCVCLLFFSSENVNFSTFKSIGNHWRPRRHTTDKNFADNCHFHLSLLIFIVSAKVIINAACMRVWIDNVDGTWNRICIYFILIVRICLLSGRDNAIVLQRRIFAKSYFRPLQKTLKGDIHFHNIIYAFISFRPVLTLTWSITEFGILGFDGCLKQFSPNGLSVLILRCEYATSSRSIDIFGNVFYASFAPCVWIRTAK